MRSPALSWPLYFLPLFSRRGRVSHRLLHSLSKQQADGLAPPCHSSEYMDPTGDVLRWSQAGPGSSPPQTQLSALCAVSATDQPSGKGALFPFLSFSRRGQAIGT